MRSACVASWLLLTATSGLPASVCGYVQDDLPARAGRLVRPFETDRDIEGVLLLRRPTHADLVMRIGEGAADWGEDTPFRVGSISKTMTARAVQVLASRGDLDLGASAATYIPELAGWPDMSIVQLLSHTAGVPDYYALPEFQKRRAGAITLDGFARWITAFPLAFQPGERSAYSNSGYKLLALIVERASGEPFGRFVRGAVLSEAAMTASGATGSPAESEVPEGFRPGHAPASVLPPPPTHPGWLIGSGSAYATPADLAAWGEATVRHRSDDPGWRPYGWGSRVLDGRAYLEQTGRIPGYAAVLRVVPDDRVVLAVVSRIESEAVVALADDVMRELYGQAPEPRQPRALLEVEPERLRDYVGTYEVAPGFMLTTRVESGGLDITVGDGDDGDYAALQPVGDDAFFFRVGYVDVEFQRGGDGSVTGLSWSGAGPFSRIR